MRTAMKLLSGLAVVALGSSALWMTGLTPAISADHFDPPATTDPNTTPTPDVAADIADVYVFPSGSASTTLAVVFGGPSALTLPAFFDRNLDFNLFVSNAGATHDPEISINFRFGVDPTNPSAHGIRLTGVPGSTGPIVMPVETVRTFNGVNIYAGLIDDPFNFDAAGLRETRQTSILSIRNDRNRFANLNSTIVALEIPNSLVRVGNGPIRVWSTSSRIRSGL